MTLTPFLIVVWVAVRGWLAAGGSLHAKAGECFGLRRSVKGTANKPRREMRPPDLLRLFGP
jgi:hypothetical protein